MNLKIVLTGGGTAGHAMANKVLIPMLKEDGWNIDYIGSHNGAEKQMIQKQGVADYHSISTGKLRRYIAWRNVTDVFRVIHGILEAYRLLKELRPHVVLSGGGFVSVPVVIAAGLLKIPVLIRETDFTIGLANRICMKIAKKIFVTFPDTEKQIEGIPSEYCGILVRPELLDTAYQMDKPESIYSDVLVMGGSQGSENINRRIRDSLQSLLCRYNIIHVTGKGKSDQGLNSQEAYRQYEYVEDMGALFAQADVVVTRCGSNAISEGLALGKRMVCIPISTKCSRGEQMDNAKYAVRCGCAVILEEEHLCLETLVQAIETVKEKPINPTLILTGEELQENCRKQMRDMRGWAMKHLEEVYAKNLRKGKNINWKNLTDWELRLYEELLEVYGE